MTERASDLLSAVADRLTADLEATGASTTETVRSRVPELILAQPEGFTEMPFRSAAAFLEVLFKSLRVESDVPWPDYYVLAREASRRYAEKGIPLVSLMEAMAIFRRAVIARITTEIADSPYADEVVLLAQSRLGDTSGI